MKKNILVGLMLSGALFVGCGDKPKEEQKGVEATPVATQAPIVAEVKPESAPAPVATESEPKVFDAVGIYSSKCASCHGSKGEGKAIFPKLAGQKKEELVKKLNGYKDGSFGNEKKAMMIPNVQNLSSDEIEKIAEVVSKF